MLAKYQQLVEQGVLCEDKAQGRAVNALAELSEQLVHASKNSSKCNSLSKLLAKLFSRDTIPSVKGVYFHGRVGRGKTLLMDLFYQNISIKKKKRIHFHRFMESVHQQLNTLSFQHKAIDNPLAYIAKSWAMDLELLCFDEFYVNDIGDAMLLAGLFKELFSLGVTLVSTSNCKPEQLYKNGLQRARFLPTISLINQHCRIISINGELDYRLRHISDAQYPNYYFNHLAGEQSLAQRFLQLSDKTALNFEAHHAGVLTINNRVIRFVKIHHKHVWFEFSELCSGPRSQRDYMQLADRFDTVLISNVPQFSGALVPAVFSGVEDNYQRSGILMAQLRVLDDEARRFIALVDEFYDRKVQLVISADVDITELYHGQQLSFEFQRCQSRLFEMQSTNFS